MDRLENVGKMRFGRGLPHHDTMSLSEEFETLVKLLNASEVHFMDELFALVDSLINGYFVLVTVGQTPVEEGALRHVVAYYCLTIHYSYFIHGLYAYEFVQATRRVRNAKLQRNLTPCGDGH